MYNAALTFKFKAWLNQDYEIVVSSNYGVNMTFKNSCFEKFFTDDSTSDKNRCK